MIENLIQIARCGLIIVVFFLPTGGLLPLTNLQAKIANRDGILAVNKVPADNTTYYNNIALIHDEFPENVLTFTTKAVSLSKKQLLDRMNIHFSWASDLFEIDIKPPFDLQTISTRLADPWMQVPLFNLLNKLKKKVLKVTPNGGMRLTITKAILPYISEATIQEASLKKSLVVWLKINKVNASNLRQIGDHFSNHWKQWEVTSIIKDYIKQKKRQLRVDEVFFPLFAKENLFTYENVVGPNCFHASIAFNNPLVSIYNFINIRKEKNHHRRMINHNELWSALNRFYMPVDPRVTPLKFGDVIIFFDMASGNGEFVYRSFKHATTYLFNNMLFNKNSKSPKSPYLILPLSMVHKMWKDRFPLLRYRVFREKRMYLSPTTYSFIDTF